MIRPLPPVSVGGVFFCPHPPNPAPGRLIQGDGPMDTSHADGCSGEDHDTIFARALNARVAEVLPRPTPLTEAPRLSERLGGQVLLKREDLTPIFLFKIRGAYNKIAMLDEISRTRGVIAA